MRDESDEADRRALERPAATSYDDRLRRAAQVVHNIVSGGNRRDPYAQALQVLGREGVTARNGEPLTARRLAKWIKEAERRGYYPPSTTHQERKETAR